MGTGKLKSKLDSYEKTVNLTIRVKKEILDNLRQYASSRETTLNSAVNQMLSQVLDWDILAAKAGWVPIPKNALVNILDKIDEKTILELAETNGKTIPNDFMLAMKGRQSIEDLLEINKNRAFSAGFSYSEIIENNYLKIIIQHDMGIKWSKYFSTFYDTAFKSLGCKAEFEIADNILVYRIDKKYYKAN